MDNAGFASMRIRMFEKRLMTGEQLDRMIKAPTLEAAFNVLRETRYSDLMQKVNRPEDFSQGLSHILAYEAREVAALTQDEDVKRFLFLRYDYHNIKVLIKSTTDPERYDDLLFPYGTLDISKCERLLETKPSAGDDNQEKALLEGLAAWNKKQNPQEVDFIVDRYMYQEMNDRVKAMNSPALQQYVREMIDFTNLLSYFRGLRVERAGKILAEAFYPGGRIRREDLFTQDILRSPALRESALNPAEKGAGNGDVDAQRLLVMLRRAEASDYMIRAVRSYFETGDIGALEKARDEFAYQAAVRSGRVTSGPEVLFSYMVRVETEITNIRIILYSVSVGKSPEEIRRDVRLSIDETERERRAHA